MSWRERFSSLPRLAAAIARFAGIDIRRHWMAAILSLVAGFAVWIVIEEVDNPRVEGRAPAEGSIEVVPVNAPDGYLVEPLQTVLVRVEAREGDLESLRRSDFRAEVDLARVDPANSPVRVPVKVVSRRNDVEVLQVIPESVDVVFSEAQKRDIEVTVRIIEGPPTGFRIKQIDGRDVPPTLDPPLVTIQGRPETVGRVDRVDLDVSLASAKTRTFTASGELVVRSADGNTLQLHVSEVRATATFEIEEVFTPSTIGLQARVTGQPAAGYVVTNVSTDPPAVEVTGPTAVIEGLRGPLTLDPVDVTGAKQTLTVTKTIQPPPNTSIERQTVVIKVEVAPIRCGASTAAPCQAATFMVAATLTNVPAGLVVQTPIIQVQVRASGPLDRIAALTTADFRAVISLAGATAGTATYTATVTSPEGITVDAPDPVTIMLLPSGVP